MKGAVPDEGRRTLLARLAALVSLVPGVDVEVGGPSLDARTDESGEDERGNDGSGIDSDGSGNYSDGDNNDGDSNDGDSGGVDSDARDVQTAVVDRIEDGTAVVLFEDAGDQRTVSAAVLPEAAREEGTVLRVPEGEALALATVDRSATEERRESAQDRLDRLAERPDGA